MHLVLQDGYRGFRIPVDAEVVSGAHRHVVVIAAVQFDDGLSTFDVPGVAGHGDDVVEDHVITQEIEVVLSVGQAFESFPDDLEEGPVSSEVRTVADVLGHESSGLVRMAGVAFCECLEAGRRSAEDGPDVVGGPDLLPAIIASAHGRVSCVLAGRYASRARAVAWHTGRRAECGSPEQADGERRQAGDRAEAEPVPGTRVVRDRADDGAADRGTAIEGHRPQGHHPGRGTGDRG